MTKNFSQQYPAWRDQKLAVYPVDAAALRVDIAADGVDALLATVARFNVAFYRLPTARSASKTAVHQLANACGLRRLKHNLYADADSLSSIQVSNQPGQQTYIPYTNRRLSWHTDGYYYPPAAQIQGMLMHCVRPAAAGGANEFMDHEIAYILLREADPAYIKALMHPQALTIPAHFQNGELIRPAQSGPVFSITPNGKLHMRYSARQRNVQWRDDSATRKAERFLLDLWEQDSSYKLHYTLQAGEGVICNNVLHCRTAFSGQERLLYRGRYLDRITGSDYAD